MIDGAIIGIDISAPQVHMGRIKDGKVEKKLKIQIKGLSQAIVLVQ